MCAANSSSIAFSIDIVLERILSNLNKYEDNPNGIIKYRLVNHKWNDTIVRIVKKSNQSFQIPLRYRSNVGRFVAASDAQRWAKEILENILVTTTTATATALPFDAVVVDRNFRLSREILTLWTQFLKIQGESIRHIKFDVMHGKLPQWEEIYSSECMSTALFATPNLESLSISVGISSNNQVPFLDLDLPQFRKLTKMSIQEYSGPYSKELLSKILCMAPNLTTLDIRSCGRLDAFANPMKMIAEELKRSLTSLSIDGGHFYYDNQFFQNRIAMEFSYLNLTTLQLNRIYGDQKYLWTKLIIQSHQSTLEKLILSDELYHDPYGNGNESAEHGSLFPSVMKNLKVLEVNLAKFKLSAVDVSPSYGIRFPVLASLTFKGYGEPVTENNDGEEWSREHLTELLPGVSGQSRTVEKFILYGRICEYDDNKLLITSDVSATFPCAVQHFRDL